MTWGCNIPCQKGRRRDVMANCVCEIVTPNVILPSSTKCDIRKAKGGPRWTSVVRQSKDLKRFLECCSLGWRRTRDARGCRFARLRNDMTECRSLELYYVFMSAMLVMLHGFGFLAPLSSASK